jgi:hypothetical protein
LIPTSLVGSISPFWPGDQPFRLACPKLAAVPLSM